jgi:subtilisin family serine protease
VGIRLGITYTLICAAVLNSSSVFANADTDLLLQSFENSGKLSRATDLLAPLRRGEEFVEVIVTIEPSEAARQLAAESQLSANSAQSMFVEGGPVFYDLANNSVARQLNETVSMRVGEFIASLNTSDIEVTTTFSYIFGFGARVTAKGLEQLIKDPKVRTIEEDMILEPHLRQGIPLINASTPRTSYDGSGISIAICDTGIDTSHPMLGGGGSPFNSKVLGGYDFGMGDADPRPSGSTPDAHGTACAGIAAGDLDTTTTSDYIGGVAPGAKLYALKISNDTNHTASSSAMISAWEWAVTHQTDNEDNPIRVISTSFGGGRSGSTCDTAVPAMTTAAANAVAAGITIFVSSGNDGYCDSMGWPACISYVNSVGAVYDASLAWRGYCLNTADTCAQTEQRSDLDCYGDQGIAWDFTSADLVTSYSNSASFLTMFAPSHDAYTTDIVGSDGYGAGNYASSFGGTSAACPYAAGAAAVLQHAALSRTGSFLSPVEVQSLLVTHGDNITDGKVAITKPRINLQRAVDAIWCRREDSNFHGETPTRP